MRSTERRFLHSTVAAYGSQLARVLIRIAGDLLLARLILPTRYGLFDLAYGIVLIAGIFRDLGLPYQLVRDERRPYGTVFLWTSGAGLALTLGLALGAPLFAGLDPGLPEVLRIYSLFVLLDGLSVVPKVFFERELEVGRLVVPEVLRGLTMAAVSITLAVLHFGVWSLVAGQLAGAALFAAMLWARARGHMPLDFQPRLIPDLISRSMTLFFIALMALPVPYVSRFVIGGMLPGRQGTFQVGQYGKARDWGFRLQELIQPAVARVLYPALVAYRGERDRFVGAYRIGTLSILALETLAAYFLFFNTEIVLLRILIGPQWAPAVPLLKILCFVPLTDPFSRLGGEVLKTEGEDRAWLAAVVLNFVSLVGFGIVLTRLLGVAGMAWASYLLLGNWVLAWRVWRVCGAEFWKLARDLLFVYLLPLPLFLGVAWLFPAESWPRLGASVVAGALVAGVYFWRFHKPFREFFRA
ncbi:MAG TPA: oligosaccharide flippase family protein [Thermoanaerobaculia bacterium]|nr:oligosaccharide flippase family protein [Thermoanaerobaculia bacterium]